MAVSMIVLSVVTIVVGLRLSFSQDDAFILYRYASNLLAGRGLVFNPGEWVEGYTCPLWLVILTGIGAVGLDIVVWAKVLGMCLAVATVWVLFAIGRMISLDDDPWWLALIAPLILASNPTFASFATSGLETALFTFLLTGTTAGFIVSIRQNRFPLWLSSGYVLLTLTRPEGTLVFGVMWLLSWVSEGKLWSGLKKMLPSLAMYLVPIVAVTAWRWITYGYPLPNPAYSKVSLDRQSFEYGLDYVWMFLRQYGWFGGSLAVALVPAVVRSPKRTIYRYLGLLFLLYSLYILIIGGDVLKGLRFFVPVLPIFALMIQEGLAVIGTRLKPTRGRIAVAALVAVLVVGQVAGYPRELRRARLESGLVEKMRALAEWFAAHQPSATVIAANSIGTLGYYTGFRIVDMVGLVDATIAHESKPVEGIQAPTRERTYDAGHVLAQHPDFIVFDTYEKPNHAGDFALYTHSGFRQGYYRYPIWMPNRNREMVIFKAKPAQDGRTFSPSDSTDVGIDFVYSLREGMIEAESHPLKAEQIFRKAITTGPQDFAQPLEWLGMLALQRRDRIEADRLFRQAVAFDSFSVYAVRYLAKMTYNDGKIEEALTWGRKLIRIDPYIPDGWLIVGWILREQGQEDAAISCWEEGLSAVGNHPDLMGVLHSTKQSYQK